MNDSFTYAGIRIVCNDALCKKRRMVLDPVVASYLTPEFRAEMDQWMAEFFGYKEEVLVCTDPLTGHKLAIVSKHSFEVLKSDPKPSRIKW
jgi:hypothetical protein